LNASGAIVAGADTYERGGDDERQAGRRLFDGLDPEHVELERVRVLEGERGVTHLCYRVRRAA
jgi:hypothetical protein